MWRFFLAPKQTPKQSNDLTALRDAWLDFQLSRRAMSATPATMEFYRYTARRFLAWCEAHSLPSPDQIKARHVRQFLAELADAGRADNTLHDYARAIRTLLRFLNAEGYIPEPVKFEMPKVATKRLPVLTADQLAQVMAACNKRDRAIVSFLADTGVRRNELRLLDWGDIDFDSGLVRIKKGKGGKARSTVLGPTARRYLLAYRRTLGTPPPDSPLLLSPKTRQRMTRHGLTLVFLRLSKLTGIHVTAHALRRTFVILSLRAGMDVLHLQALLGHASLDMVTHYAQMVDSDLLQSHRAHSPIENLNRLKGGEKDT